MNGQQDLFSYITHDPIKNPCCVIKDGKVEDLTWEELFNPSYDTLECVRANDFFEWIGVKNPWRKKTFIERLLKIE